MSYHDGINERRKTSSFHWDPETSIRPGDFVNPRSISRFFVILPLLVLLCFSVLIVSFSFYVMTIPCKSRGLYRRLICTYVTYPWFEALALLLPQTKIFITEDSDMPDGIGPGVIIVNHQFDRDWWNMFAVMRCVGQHGRVKMLLPEEMRHIPLLGWVLQLLDFPFLGRSWGADDHGPLQRHLETFQGGNETTFFVLFPEGAKLDQQTHKMSVAFAKQEGRPIMDHLLLPHIRGFQLFLDALQTTSPSVYDVTMVVGGYTGQQPSSYPSRFVQFMALLLDVRPRSSRGEEIDLVFIRIKRFSGDAVRTDPRWLDRQWELKDLQLDHFGRYGAFPSSATYRPSTAHAGSHIRSVSQNTNTAPVRALGNTQSIHAESSLLALGWLCFLPFVCPIMIFFGLPLVMIARVLQDAKQFLLPGGRAGSRAQGRSSLLGLSSPHCPQTPFCSPAKFHETGVLRSRRRGNTHPIVKTCQ